MFWQARLSCVSVKPQVQCLVAIHVAWSLPRSGAMWGPVGQDADIKAHPLPSVQAAPLWGALPYLPPHLEIGPRAESPRSTLAHVDRGPCSEESGHLPLPTRQAFPNLPSDRGPKSRTPRPSRHSAAPQGPGASLCEGRDRVTPPSCPRSCPAAWDPHGPTALPLRTGSWAVKMGIQGVDTRNLKRMALLEKRCG